MRSITIVDSPTALPSARRIEIRRAAIAALRTRLPRQLSGEVELALANAEAFLRDAAIAQIDAYADAVVAPSWARPELDSLTARLATRRMALAEDVEAARCLAGGMNTATEGQNVLANALLGELEAAERQLARTQDAMRALAEAVPRKSGRGGPAAELQEDPLVNLAFSWGLALLDGGLSLRVPRQNALQHALEAMVEAIHKQIGSDPPKPFACNRAVKIAAADAISMSQGDDI